VDEVAADASVIAKWFKTDGEANVGEAQLLRQRFLSGALVLVVPPLLFLELINTAARRWRWPAVRLDALASDLVRLPFAVREPRLEAVAHWCGRGLAAYDASYVAVAAQRGVPLITTDEEVLAAAGGLARPLSGYR
jgi:predicted nucleic acid-binding protein